ncbi:MAG: hypothetical protein HY902_07720 [Deltaproteobacteria bacterium]|nr:hypothetical protein [Deltaproteobacteria bacterium]
MTDHPMTTNDYNHILAELAKLSRNHLLYFRLEVGRLLLDRFFDGDIATYRSVAPNKGTSFAAFASSCADQLGELGLGEQVLRQCILAHVTVRELPAAAAHQLGFSQVVELTRVPDAANRRALAQAAVDNHWTSRQIKDAAAAIAAGKWIDGDPHTPGLQPPAADPEEPGAPQQGRVITRVEKAAAQLGELAAQLEAVAEHKLSGPRRARLQAALDQLEARLQAMRARLG